MYTNGVQKKRTQKSNKPFGPVPRSISMHSALRRFFQTVHGLGVSFRAVVPQWNAHTACHWRGRASGAFTHCFHRLSFFPFDLASFPICFLDGIENIHSQSAFLPFPFPFPLPFLCFPCRVLPCPSFPFLFFAFLSNMHFRFPGKTYFKLHFFPLHLSRFARTNEKLMMARFKKSTQLNQLFNKSHR